MRCVCELFALSQHAPKPSPERAAKKKKAGKASRIAVGAEGGGTMSSFLTEWIKERMTAPTEVETSINRHLRTTAKQAKMLYVWGWVV